ncbi:XRE family transcriptional regulator [Erwinia pyrifoliae]|uniref:helix-turn-helix domain-containing protein n=1 Tax=Erwinia pyrifoliae TaxID=79967 RepID=UPI0021D7BF99|nr:XRE family transcriptional regulator [Erwinia pyrifoliae]MCU8586765.1 XRE family transcriptional regulator [Erwinia pyrifoliae]
MKNIIDHTCGHVNTEFYQMMSVGARLVEERKRFGLNQANFGALAGCARNTQANYERDERHPDSKYLSALADKGVDVLYVLTGRRTPDVGDTTDDEIELIKLYRSAPLVVKAAALAALTAGSSAHSAINVSGSGQRVAGRDYHEGEK